MGSKPENMSNLDPSTFENDIAKSSLILTETFKDQTEQIFSAEKDTIYNNGFVLNATHWPSQDFALPTINHGTNLEFKGKFDFNKGVVALDNIRIYTRQK